MVTFVNEAMGSEKYLTSVNRGYQKAMFGLYARRLRVTYRNGVVLVKPVPGYIRVRGIWYCYNTGLECEQITDFVAMTLKEGVRG
jgi:hypothetical protein